MRDFRKQTVFFCADDGAYMGLVVGRYGIFYRCDKYFFKNRKPGDAICTNHFSLKEREDLYAELSFLEGKGGLKAGQKGLAGPIHYEISEVNNQLIKVKVRREDKERK